MQTAPIRVTTELPTPREMPKSGADGESSLVPGDSAEGAARRPAGEPASEVEGTMQARAAADGAWRMVAGRAIELLAKPAFVLDVRGTVLLINDELRRLLGRTSDEAIDHGWLQLVVPEEARGATEQAFRQALLGRASELECKAVTRRGVRLSLRLETTAIGAGASALLLAIVRESEREGAADEAPIDGVQYEISTAALDWGAIRELRNRGGNVAAARGHTCFEWLEHRATPCPGCPARSLREDESVTFVLPSRDADLPLRLVSARATRSDGAAIVQHELAPNILQQVVDAKLLVVARQRHLSPRERDVLRALLHGDSSQDIAAALGISPRTVKFHQANLLRKLGADSRLELVRALS